MASVRSLSRWVECRKFYQHSRLLQLNDANNPEKLRVGFGSFHSEGPEYLIRVPPSQWSNSIVTDLPRPPDVCMCLPGTNSMREQFCIDFKNWTFINHGAFGATLRCVMEHTHAWRLKQEHQPLLFFDRLLFPEIIRTTHRMAAFLHALPTDMVFVPNATAALSTILHSLGKTLQPGDTILSLDVAYGSVKKMIRQVCEKTAATSVELPVRFPLNSKQDLTDIVRAYLLECPRHALPSVAIFDHVTSNTALVLPVVELAELIKTHSPATLVLVDGAHGPVQLPLNMNDLKEAGVHFYAANFHKWMCGAKSAGLLWVACEKEKSLLEPLIISHGYGNGFTSDFIWDGCRDYAPILSLASALDFWEAHGLHRVQSYSYGLLQKATAYLKDQWGTKGILLSESEPTLHASMAIIQLPENRDYAVCMEPIRKIRQTSENCTNNLNKSEVTKQEDTVITNVHIQDWLFQQGIEVPVKSIHGKWYVRISAHIYNRMEDYEHLSEAILSLPTC
eukprot:gene8703-1092_t